MPEDMSKPRDPPAGFKNKNNLEVPVGTFCDDVSVEIFVRRGCRGTYSEIKLKRTDTTLDLSQKAKRATEQKEGRRRVGLYTWAKSLRGASALAFWGRCLGDDDVERRRKTQRWAVNVGREGGDGG